MFDQCRLFVTNLVKSVKPKQKVLVQCVLATKQNSFLGKTVSQPHHNHHHMSDQMVSAPKL